MVHSKNNSKKCKDQGCIGKGGCKCKTIDSKKYYNSIKNNKINFDRKPK